MNAPVQGAWASFLPRRSVSMRRRRCWMWRPALKPSPPTTRASSATSGTAAPPSPERTSATTGRRDIRRQRRACQAQQDPRCPLSPVLVKEIDQTQRRGRWIVSKLNGDMLSYRAAPEPFENCTYVQLDPDQRDGGAATAAHLRHRACLRGMPTTTLQELMGHEDIETTRGT